MTDFSIRPSHRGPNDEPIPLNRHLDDVAERAADLLVPAEARTPEGESLRDLTRRIALVHDIGKLTDWFRQHLSEEKEPAGPTHHAPVGALVAHYVLSVSGFDGTDPLVGFLAVARHHGRLPDTGSYVQRTSADSTKSRLHKLFREETFEQIDHIDDTVPELADALIDDATDGDGSWTEFHQRATEACERGRHEDIASHVLGGVTLTSLETERLSDRFYDGVLQAWSALVFADKTSAASLTTGIDVDEAAYEATVPERGAIDKHVRELMTEAASQELDADTRQLNADRERARRRVRARAMQFARRDDSIATLTLPTGLGKTLSGLDAALTVLDETPGDGRVVYALPFTSIIDQVASVSSDVFPVDAHDDLLAVDHHLEETQIPLPEYPETVADDEKEHLATMLGESWRSGLVVTTFVQLFESLAGPANGQSMKLPSLYGSVIVLDEPQALPLDWWPLVERLAELLAEAYDATIISMTATQPKLFTEGGRPYELIGDPDPYFEPLDRLTFDLHPSTETALDGDPVPVAYTDAADRIAERLDTGNSTLAICNTIDSARELAAALDDRSGPVNVNEVYHRRLQSHEGWTDDLDADETVTAALDATTGDEPLLVHLTTRHRPVDRAHLIEVASTLTERNVPIAFVSTQLVEAGVDVSFDEVFRDFAPLDSLVQAAGRCNRSFDRDRGRVTVWTLASPGGREHTPSSSVYDRGGDSLTKLTALALGDVYDGDPIPEPTVTREAVETYFQSLDERGVGSREYVDLVDRADAEQLGALSLIDERPAVEIITARTRTEANAVREIRDAYTTDWDRFDDLLDRTKPVQVSVPFYGHNEESNPLGHCEWLYPDAERRWIDGRSGRDNGFFDATKGVVIPDTSAEARLL
ncbi:CRISPR-associated endonuclease Cas3'' [Halalkalicoccus sp. NIPERK01]|uniref:CRISPR-associated endonuclease Cas3'' n=1 Tax=Halalkalicoccus sp. NIPERK01 TaxID=3053469 RepID=UPI00256F43E8|nr:CRISPR-associated endonuclease Cas3'' [Halalkalicoccus sp. NIPERK01]MDL5360927.1 CRISPR-associated endonuclease Cas3'' [Halalkalicoccus sp. NIPERK01]